MEIIKGKIKTAQKVVIYGPEGVGKSTIASNFPNPIFIDTEGSTKQLDVARTPAPSSWTILKSQVEYFIKNPKLYGTIIIDTADWAERMCIDHICTIGKVDGIEGYGYGKGYVYLAEEFGKFLDLLTELVEKGVNVVLTAHALMKKIDVPEETGSYDRWEMKLGKKSTPLVKEWADAVLFAHFQTIVENVDGQGATKGKNKARGGKRIIHTTHSVFWDAKNRWGLPDEVPFDYQYISAHIVGEQTPAAAAPTPTVSPADTSTLPDLKGFQTILPHVEIDVSGLPKALADLMLENCVGKEHLQQIVAKKKYFPADMPVENYPEDFIKGVLIAAWDKVYDAVKQLDGYVPF